MDIRGSGKSWTTSDNSEGRRGATEGLREVEDD